MSTDEARKEWTMFAAAALQGILSAARIEQGERHLHFAVIKQAMSDATAVANDMTERADNRWRDAEEEEKAGTRASSRT